MKTRLLLFILLMTGGILSAQDTIRTLVISEVRSDDARESYVEITNVGTDTLNLAQFEIGIVGPWTTPVDINDITGKWFNPGTDYWFMLPDKDLAPNKSFVLAAFYDWNEEQYLKDRTKGWQVGYKHEFLKLADLQLHFAESPNNDPTDSIVPYYHVLETWSGRECIYLRHHVTPTDSVVIDQYNGVFDETDGTRNDQPLSVAGFTNATSQATLVRKFSVKTGNTDFSKARGTDLADSEWMPIPLQWGSWEMFRSLFWTVGNHGDYNLDEATLTSSTVDINWVDSVLTVPWGVRRDDSLMFQFDRKPGLAWHYDRSADTITGAEDSTFYSCRTGDKFTIYACGNELDWITFDIVVAPPTADANIVVQKNIPDHHLVYSAYPPSWIVTDKVPGMDTIMEIPFGTRADTLLKYLEKAPKASWEFEWLDGIPRTDLKTGDILKVTAESGAVKRYYIKPNKYLKSHNAYIASITWPDIPEFYKDLYGWVGDTIPNFTASSYDYRVSVPYDVTGIPALVGKPEDPNAKVEVDRAKNLTGTVADRTVTFTTTATDDTSHLSYRILLEKQKDYTNTQPWIAEPFFTQVVHQDQWTNYLNEVCNPGTEPLDLSNYMIAWDWTTDPATVISWNNATTEWGNRYRRYIPGYKWQSEAEWGITPRIAVQDVNVNPIVQPGDVFVTGSIFATWAMGYPWFLSLACDIDFGHNPWGETVNNGNAAGDWMSSTGFLFKILNDSIKLGLKPATDPNDFQLIDIFGDGNASQWVIGGVNAEQTATWIRKPQFYQGRTGLGESFGTNEEDSEWLFYNRSYWQAHGVGWPMDIMSDGVGMGSHFMDAVTAYKSTVSSGLYKVTEGYSMDEQILGLVIGTTVNDFETNLVKADTGQVLTVISGTSGDTLTETDVIVNNDLLVVLSADGKSTSQYTLIEGGLSHDAVLKSTKYTVKVTGETGTVSGFYYGLTLRNLLDKISVPSGALLSVIDANDAYVPLVLLNYDTLLVDVGVSKDVYLEVIAEDNYTKILYQLMPNTMNKGAFVTSNIFEVNQEASLINLVPENIAVSGLMTHLIPAPGATVKLVDKLGFERTIGNVVKDDRIVATSEDGQTTKVYYLQVLVQQSNYFAYVQSDIYAVDQLAFTIAGNFDNISSLVSDVLSNLIPAEKATMKVTNAAGVENTGTLALGDVLEVTAGDGITQVTYSLVIKNGYEAYVMSDLFVVSQANLMILGPDINEEMTISNFIANLTAAPNATFMVTDKAGVQKTTGNLADGDVVVVTAGDNVTKVTYSIDVIKNVYDAYVLSDVYVVNQGNLVISGSDIKEKVTVSSFSANLIVAPNATFVVTDKNGVEKTTGNLAVGDLVVVTAEDKVTKVTYSIVVLKNSSEAYVWSDVYFISQVDLLIYGSDITETLTVSSFVANLIIAPNATLMVKDKDGVEKTTGNLAIGDIVIVTAEDNVTKVTYAIDFATGMSRMNNSSVNVYPNPSTGLIYVSGLEPGNRVFVSNMLGQRLIDKVVRQNIESINLEGHAAGLYYVTINNGNQVVGRYKLVLQ